MLGVEAGMNISPLPINPVKLMVRSCILKWDRPPKAKQDKKATKTITHTNRPAQNLISKLNTTPTIIAINTHKAAADQVFYISDTTFFN